MQINKLTPTLDVTKQWDKQLIINVINELVNGNFNALLLAPTVIQPTPIDGMIVFADGVYWNPGSGKGFYGFYNGTWKFLG